MFKKIIWAVFVLLVAIAFIVNVTDLFESEHVLEGLALTFFLFLAMGLWGMRYKSTIPSVFTPFSNRTNIIIYSAIILFFLILIIYILSIQIMEGRLIF